MTTNADLQISPKDQGFTLVEASEVRRALSAAGSLADWDAVEARADGITAHLREDRRHIADDDIARLKVV